MKYRGVPWSTVEYRGVPWGTVEYRGVPGSTVEYRGVPWGTGEYRGVPWSTMKYRGVPWSTGEYRGVPTVGSESVSRTMGPRMSIVSQPVCSIELPLRAAGVPPCWGAQPTPCKSALLVWSERPSGLGHCRTPCVVGCHATGCVCCVP